MLLVPLVLQVLQDVLQSLTALKEWCFRFLLDPTANSPLMEDSRKEILWIIESLLEMENRAPEERKVKLGCRGYLGNLACCRGLKECL